MAGEHLTDVQKAMLADFYVVSCLLFFCCAVIGFAFHEITDLRATVHELRGDQEAMFYQYLALNLSYTKMEHSYRGVREQLCKADVREFCDAPALYFDVCNQRVCTQLFSGEYCRTYTCTGNATAFNPTVVLYTTGEFENVTCDSATYNCMNIHP